MLHAQFLDILSRQLSDSTGRDQPIESVESVSGGDINTCYLLHCNDEKYFLKTNRHAVAATMFSAEFQGLQALRQQQPIRVPEPLALGEHRGLHYLLMEALDLVPRGSWEAMGRGLADIHQIANRAFGWHDDNFIGTSPQTNHWQETWRDFWWTCRLQPQLQMIRDQGYSDLTSREAALKAASYRVLSAHAPTPSLVHGDLWGGNAAFCANGQPSIYDPACYFGDREVDLALTQLFGGFSPAFYQAYEQAWPLPPGHELRRELYNLYHLLNHLNLFGSGYLSPCIATIDRLTA